MKQRPAQSGVSPSRNIGTVGANPTLGVAQKRGEALSQGGGSERLYSVLRTGGVTINNRAVARNARAILWKNVPESGSAVDLKVSLSLLLSIYMYAKTAAKGI